MVIVIEGDCLDIMKIMDDNTFDSIVTDPPAGISFMGKKWDHDKGGRNQWIAWMTTVATECLRVIKPGGHALVWSIPRTSHWTATAWEDAGWECRDKIVHIFGSGFPKSLNISKSLDAMLGAEREVIGNRTRVYGYEKDYHNSFDNALFDVGNNNKITAPTTDIAKLFDGYGTSLKPAHEDWLLFRKPLAGTVAQNVLKYGVGGINIDGCRVGTADNTGRPQGSDIRGGSFVGSNKKSTLVTESNVLGRFPANLILDDSDEVRELFPHSKSGAMTKPYVYTNTGHSIGKPAGSTKTLCESSEGSTARFFYCAKASRSERNDGCEGLFVLKSNTSQETIDEIKKLLNN